MTMINESRPYSTSTDYLGGPLFSGIDIFAGILVVLMILGPMFAGATHANPLGWGSQTQQHDMK